MSAERALPEAAGSARALAWHILTRLERGGAWAETLLDRGLAEHPLSSADARLARELVFGTVKARGFLDHVLSAHYRAGQKPSGALLTLLRLGAYQLLMLSKVPPHAAIHATVEIGKPHLHPSRVKFVNAVLRSISRQGIPPLPDPAGDLPGYLAARHSFPRWIAERWAARFGREAAEALMSAANETPPVVVRVNTQLTKTEALRERWAQAGVTSEPGPLPESLVLTSAQDPAQLPGYADGWFYFQDAASQLAAQVLDPKPGQTVLDLCSAPGGKATHAAQLQQDQGRVLAHDIHPAKRALILENARRLRLASIQVIDRLPETLMAERVLVDAPCSGLGTLRRHAEGRWRVFPDDLPRLARLQAELLTQGAGRVAPGGILVYSTCTTEPEENEQLVRGFLAGHPAFRLRRDLGGLPEWLRPFWGADGFIRTYPGFPDLDGMFLARLEREP